MAIMDRIRQVAGDGGVPKDVTDRVERGRRDMQKDAPKRRLCMKFEKGETFWYLNEDGQLRQQDLVTRIGGGGKPRHRIRLSHNFIRPIIEGKISAATQRVPAYEVLPSTADPERESAAKLAGKVAVFGYDKWQIRKVTQKVVKLALAGGGAGFAMPYFDTNVGPYVNVGTNENGTPRYVGQGEVKIRVLSGNQVMWEPGVDFDDSPWWAIEDARPIDEVEAMPGYTGTKLKPDATTADLPSEKRSENLVLVTEYLERPSARHPQGRRLVMAQKRLIVPPEPYPLMGPDGSPIDEPCIHRLVYTQDPDTDRDFGLVWQLIDPQRVIQDCINKAVEWKNRCLIPQWIAEEGSLIEPPNDEPGFVNYYRQGTRNPPTPAAVPAIPDSLFRLHDMMLEDMRSMGADINAQPAPDVAAATVQATIEQSNARWASFIGDLAEWHSKVMRHCLALVACYYTEPRLLQVRGRFGFEPIQDFKGASLMDQMDVIVLPGSLEYRTKQQIAQQVYQYADRGWISPQQAMAAIDRGTAEKLIQSYELDIARAWRIIQKIRDGSVMEMAPRTRTDPQTGMPMTDEQGLPMEIPGYMPTEWDNLDVWQSVFADWFKTEEFDQIDPSMQEVGKQIWEGTQQLKAEAQQRELAAQNAQAEALGMQNAARPTAGKPNPSLPGGIPAPGGDGSPTSPTQG